MEILVLGLTQQLATHERESYVIPIDNIGTTVLVAELVTANFDLAILILTVSLLTDPGTKEPTFTERAPADGQGYCSADPILASTHYTVADPTSQQRILELETELTKAKPPKGTLFCPSRPQAHFKYTRHDSHPSSTTRTPHYDFYF